MKKHPQTYLIIIAILLGILIFSPIYNLLFQNEMAFGFPFTFLTYKNFHSTNGIGESYHFLPLSFIWNLIIFTITLFLMRYIIKR